MFVFDVDGTGSLRIHLQAPFRNRVLTPEMQAYSSAISEVRSSVECLRTSSVISSFWTSTKI